jgi:hypothetical protein
MVSRITSIAGSALGLWTGRSFCLVEERGQLAQ